jgi:tRNA A37 threonylcarbamoyladenosine dehydratase
MAEWTEEQNFYSKRRFNNLQNANVLVGLGGVGSFAAEF